MDLLINGGVLNFNGNILLSRIYQRFFHGGPYSLVCTIVLSLHLQALLCRKKIQIGIPLNKAEQKTSERAPACD